MNIEIYRRGGEFVDSANRPVSWRPCAFLGALTTLTLGVFASASATTITQITAYPTWQCAVSDTFGDPDNVALKLTSGITVASGKVTVDFGALTSTKLVSLLGTLSFRELYVELSGFTAGATAADWKIVFPLVIQNKIV